MSCAKCKFFQFFNEYTSEDVDGEGICRRFPPIHSGAHSDTSGFPVLYQDEWCGEFQRSSIVEESADVLNSVQKDFLIYLNAALRNSAGKRKTANTREFGAIVYVEVKAAAEELGVSTKLISSVCRDVFLFDVYKGNDGIRIILDEAKIKAALVRFGIEE